MSRRRPLRALVLTAALALAPAAVVAPTAATAAPAGTSVQSTWHADQARVPAARAAGRSGAGIVVAVLDSWVDRSHPDFEGRVLPGADCLGGTCVGGAASADACDHGTHVAGTVAASSFGVAPEATVLPVRVLAFDAETGECLGDPDDVAAGIRWAVAQGARVLNLSLGPDVPGLTTSSSLPAAVQEAADADVLVVFSAGNASLPLADSYSGAALVVAATGPDGRLASYSQRSVGVDLAAPGGDPARADTCSRADCVTSLYPADRYAVAAGTSMAAPHVSGTAALLLAQDPTRTRDDVAARLTSTARPLPEAGSGALDAAAALAVQPRQPAAAPAAPPARPGARPGTAARSEDAPLRAPAPVAPRRSAAPVRPPSTPGSAPPVPVAPRPAAPPQRVPAPVALDVPAPALPDGPVRAAVALLALAAAGTVVVARR